MKTGSAVRQLEAFEQLLLLVAYEGFGAKEAGDDLPGIVTIPEGGMASGLEVKDWCTWCELQRFKAEKERLDERSSRKFKSLTGRYYRRLCDRAEGKKFCALEECKYNLCPNCDGALRPEEAGRVSGYRIINAICDCGYKRYLYLEKVIEGAV